MNVIKGDVDITNLAIKEFPEFLKDSIIHGSFYCGNNLLRSLKGGPKEVHGSFDCSNNKLTNLESCPEIIVNGSRWDTVNNGRRGFYFSCSHNNITSLKGCPKILNTHFYCYRNKLTSLSDGPQFVRFNYMCGRNSKDFNLTYVLTVCKVEGYVTTS